MGTIVVNNLNKGYKQYPTRWSRLIEWLDPRRKVRHTLHWVLQGISFHVRPGEAVGIIGLNGAGKSTLLKILVGTTCPTSGSVHVTGRVAALLELGMGFHPDFTGRQNVFMAGQLLGYSVEDITRLMPEIEAFAEIGDYIDQPVRVYSSGMQMRLAFSVATATRPDVLIVDEALSVGDTYFQAKSFLRIREFRELGTTLLFVSHDKNSIQSICDRAILLNSGKLELISDPVAVFDRYTAMLADRTATSIKQSRSFEGKSQTESGSLEATIAQIDLMDDKGQLIETAAVGKKLLAKVHVKVHQDLEGLVLGFGIMDRLGQVVFGTNTWLTKQYIEKAKAGDVLIFSSMFTTNLGPGNYMINCVLVKDNSYSQKIYHMIRGKVSLEIINTDKLEFTGCGWGDITFSIDHEHSENPCV